MTHQRLTATFTCPHAEEERIEMTCSVSNCTGSGRVVHIRTNLFGDGKHFTDFQKALELKGV